VSGQARWNWRRRNGAAYNTQSRAVAIYDRSAWLAGEHEWDNRCSWVNADIDVPVDEVLQHLDMIFAARAEARKGRSEYTVK